MEILEHLYKYCYNLILQLDVKLAWFTFGVLSDTGVGVGVARMVELTWEWV